MYEIDCATFTAEAAVDDANRFGAIVLFIRGVYLLKGRLILKRNPVWIIFIVAALLVSMVQVMGQDEYLPEQPEILWDTWGVPHIYSADNEGLFYGFGWAQAQNHGNLILKLYGQARGRAAEYWGAEFVESDTLVRTLGIPQQAVDGYNALDDEFKAYVNAFAQGLNDYITENPDRIGEDWKAVLPVTAIDVIGHGIRVLRYTFVAQSGIDYALDHGQSPLADGSNGWAIAPSHSASGNAMLVANPHQPWQDLGLWIEAHLIGSDMNVYGSALVGNPVLGIGFNQYLGWTHTVNTHDGWDLYQLTMSDDGEMYLYDGEERPFEVHEETMQVKQEDGTFEALPLKIMNAVQGPVLSIDDGTALALRVVGENSFGASQEWWEMGKATNLEEFEAALRPLRIPMFTVIYADREGNIMHLFNEQVPIREEGDWAFWNNTTRVDEGSLAIIPGDSSKYVWTAYHPYEDLPRVVNPESGWVQNANEPPWTATLPLPFETDDFPAYMLPPAYTWPRPVRSLRMLSEDDSITFVELIDYKQSTFLELTNWCLDDLLAVASASDDPLVQKAVEILVIWDRQTNADSVGAVLFAAWANDYITPLGFAAFETTWDVNDPLNTPRGLADPEAAVESLKKVSKQLDALKMFGGGMDVPYGDIFRLRYGDYDLPANGAPDLLGSFQILTFVQDSDQRFYPVHGDSYIAIVEFSDPIRAKVLLTYGNSTQPDSPHFGDQLELFSRKELRDAWLTRDEIEAHLEEKIVLSSR